MLFNSFTFIFAFLPVVLIGFHLLTRAGRGDLAIWFLVAASLVFYGWWNWSLVAMLAGSVVANFLLGRRLALQPSSGLLALGVTFNLALLAWFKYANFMADTVNAIAGTSFTFGAIILPLAISFFTFQQIAFLVDARRGLATEPRFGRYALFVTFFPQLIAGPIVHHGEMLPQYDRPSRIRLTHANLAVGFTIFAIGLFKKVMFADPMGAYADSVFGAAAHGDPVSFVSAWAGTAAFGLEIYFDFSGYSDMAIGLARMFGIRLPLNFDSPYKADNIIEFWRRWHMTLSRFLRDYLYFPLGGNRRGRPRRYANLMVVMVLGGLWHGAAWTFVAWGALHGAYLIVNHAWIAVRRAVGIGDRRPFGGIAGRALTLLAVFFAWTFFRAENWQAAGIMLDGMTGSAGVWLPASYAAVFDPLTPLLEGIGIRFGVEPDPEAYPTLPILLSIVGLLAFVLFLPNTQEWMARARPALDFRNRAGAIARGLLWRANALTGVAMAAVACVALGALLQGERHEFIYFQF